MNQNELPLQTGAESFGILLWLQEGLKAWERLVAREWILGPFQEARYLHPM